MDGKPFLNITTSELMVINDLDIERIAVHETKAQAPLIVDTDAPISHSIMLQCLQFVRRRDAQIFDSDRRVQLRQPNCRTGLDRKRKATRLARCIKTFRFSISEGLDHENNKQIVYIGQV